jgi:hypothetical protein
MSAEPRSDKMGSLEEHRRIPKESRRRRLRERLVIESRIALSAYQMQEDRSTSCIGLGWARQADPGTELFVQQDEEKALATPQNTVIP